MKKNLKTRTLTRTLFLSLISVGIIRVSQQPTVLELTKRMSDKMRIRHQGIPLILTARRAKTKADDRKMATTTRSLLGRGENPAAQDESGMTALMWAAKNGAINVLKALLENPKALATINMKDKEGKAALAYAAAANVHKKIGWYPKAGNVKIVELLLRHNATPTVIAFRQTKNRTIQGMIARKEIEAGTGEFSAKLSRSGRRTYRIKHHFKALK